MIFSLARLENLGMTCQQQLLPSLCDQIMKMNVEGVKKRWLFINNDKPPGSDNLDGKLLRIIGDDIVTPICHIVLGSRFPFALMPGGKKK
jgi:hypothetical protein